MFRRQPTVVSVLRCFRCCGCCAGVDLGAVTTRTGGGYHNRTKDPSPYRQNKHCSVAVPVEAPPDRRTSHRREVVVVVYGGGGGGVCMVIVGVGVGSLAAGVCVVVVGVVVGGGSFLVVDILFVGMQELSRFRLICD
jgi:hypothetical protein